MQGIVPFVRECYPGLLVRAELQMYTDTMMTPKRCVVHNQGQ